MAHPLLLLLITPLFVTVSHSQSILQIHSLLFGNTSTLNTTTTDDHYFCNSEPQPPLSLSCYEGNITQLHITGNGTDQNPPPISSSFTSPVLFDAVSSLTTLKVLSLVSLGLSGPLPESLGLLTSLEILNVSLNRFNGPIPVQLSALKNLQTLVLDHNSFTGEVPAWIGWLRVLSHLSLKNNSLSGSLPNSITRLRSLRVLALSSNELSGEVPDLRNLTNLQVLDLEHNSFGPHFPGIHKSLVYLSLRNNSFGFSIPSEASTYYQLLKLDVSLNRFVGPFSPSILSLPSMTYLDISGNKLTALLMQNLSCGSELTFVNLSSNFLTGKLPSCLESENTSSKIINYAGNCLSDQEQEQHPSSFCRNEALAVQIAPRDEQSGKKSYAKPVIASSMVGGIALVGVVYFVARHRENFAKNCRDHKHDVKASSTRSIIENVSAINTAKLLTDARYISQTMKLGATLPPYRQFTLEELREATCNFDASSLIRGGSNSRTYRGHLGDGTPVMIKSLKMRKRRNQQSFTNHINTISRLRHKHLVSVMGHCFESCPDDSNVNIVHLILEFVPNGNLRSFVSEGGDGEKFNWMQRIGAAIGVAKGVQFLHSGNIPGLFSNNLKIKDVLLDQDLHAKISNYNLPLLAENQATRLLQGATGVSSAGSKSGAQESWHENSDDIFDIGAIFLEIITGRPINSDEDTRVSRDILQASITVDETARRNIADPRIAKDCSDESLIMFMEICLRCIAHNPAERPSVEDVLWNLQFAMQIQDSCRGYYTQDIP